MRLGGEGGRVDERRDGQQVLQLLFRGSEEGGEARGDDLENAGVAPLVSTVNPRRKAHSFHTLSEIEAFSSPWFSSDRQACSLSVSVRIFRMLSSTRSSTALDSGAEWRERRKSRKERRRGCEGMWSRRRSRGAE